MNRKILFRGKRVDNGKWVYGSLFHDPDIGFSSIMGFEYSYSESGPEREETDYEVAPATVGQYTGLTDKNGQKIFEGDIISVYWNGKRNSAVNFGHGMFKALGISLSTWVAVKSCGTTVIGNIHANPELVGGAEHE